MSRWLLRWAVVLPLRKDSWASGIERSCLRSSTAMKIASVEHLDNARVTHSARSLPRFGLLSTQGCRRKSERHCSRTPCFACCPDSRSHRTVPPGVTVKHLLAPRSALAHLPFLSQHLSIMLAKWALDRRVPIRIVQATGAAWLQSANIPDPKQASALNARAKICIAGYSISAGMHLQ